MSLVRQVEELFLLKSSLLPNEFLDFLDDSISWQSAMNHLSSGGTFDTLESLPSVPADFVIKVQESSLAFRIKLSREYASEPTVFDVNIYGNIHKMEQERWMNIVQAKRCELTGAEFPVYELLSSHLLPLLHEELASNLVAEREPDPVLPSACTETHHLSHALFTSHHLISTQKRKSLKEWAVEHNLLGLAKVGYPGIIYCSGSQPDVQEFVRKVKGMQWLALHTKFMEPLPNDLAGIQQQRWKEVEKIGEVIEEMKRYGRERYAYDFGIGTRGLKE